MEQLPGLVTDSLDYRRRTVSERGHRDTGEQVHVSPAPLIEEQGALTAHELDLGPAIGCMRKRCSRSARPGFTG